MFTLETRMSDALALRPELRTLLPAFHPAFERLNHPVLGRVLPRLVTVADAARVAGVDPLALLAAMNLPGSQGHPPVPADRSPTPPPIWLSAAVPVIFDARPQLAAGEEPFAAIMARLHALRPGEVLTVQAPFEPAPLLRLMGTRGWRTHGTWAPEAFEASFERPLELGDAPVSVPAERIARDAAGLTLDVRGLEPPEPMRLVLATLDGDDALPLRILHHREPALLYPRLAERGLRWSVVQIGDHVEILVDRQP